jgi:phospholipid/cholesterol/gamma-HCH transport system substrate-binding protein
MSRRLRRPATMRLLATALVAGVVLSGCSLGGGGDHTFHATFTRAVQLFPGGRVRVLGVNVGHIVSVQESTGDRGVDVTFQIDDSSVRLPPNVNAAIVPASLLGERYIQLFPAYDGGATLADGSNIPESRTAVPAEPDEVLRSLQDYLGALDPNTVTKFVENAATVLQGNGQTLNQVIAHAANVMDTLASKKDDLAALITQLDTITRALATRQKGLAELIQTYDTVAGTLNDNRSALEGTITGLNAAAAQLAGLLTAQKGTLNTDINTLTRTGRTIHENIGQLTATGHWATLLFSAASRAVEYDHSWLRLNNQGQEIGALILLRLEERLMDLCQQVGVQCQSSNWWAAHVPQLFCFTGHCRTAKGSPARALAKAIAAMPRLQGAIVQGSTLTRADGQPIPLLELMNRLLEGTVGNPNLGAEAAG